jgi:hypothetical protein
MPRTVPVISHARLRTLKYIACFSLLALSFWLCAHKVNLSKATVSDYAAYWSASRLLLTGHNPYDPAQVLAVEKTVGWVPVPLVMRNPPWAFALVLPFGFFGYKLSRVLWLFPQIAIVIACVPWLWRQHARSGSNRWAAWLLAGTFFPALWVMIMGQITPLILLGVVGFLYCERGQRANGWLQASCLVLIALKPQLLYLFWIALFLSVIRSLQSIESASKENRRWALLAKFAVLLLATSALPLIIDARVWSEYFRYLRDTPILQEIIPTFGNMLRIRTQVRWTQFLPMYGGCAWILWYWIRKRNDWNWSEEMPVLLLASLVTTTYSWFYDQIVLLPAILYVMALNFPTRNRTHLVSVLGLYLVVDFVVVAIFQHGQRLTNFQLLWTAPAWCLLFITLRWLARKMRSEEVEPSLKSPADSTQPASYASNLAA